MYGSFLGNLLGSLYFFYFQVAGIFLMSKILKKEKWLTTLLMGSVAGSVLLQWVPTIFSFFFDFTLTSHLLALAAVLPIYIFAGSTGWAYTKACTTFPKQVKEHNGFFCLMFPLLLLWIYLLYTHTLPQDLDGNMLTGQCTYGDMNMHLGFITSIANQQTFPPQYSLYPDMRLSYPFLSDSISSSIYLMGASLRYAYILPMITAFLQIVGCVYLLALTLFSSKAKGILTMVFYLLNGGFGFVYFMDWNSKNLLTIKDIFTGFYTTPTNLIDYNIRWVNLIADMFLPQRATLFGYAVLLPTIWFLYKGVFQKEKGYFLPAGILTCALPMIHTHSFLGMALVSASWLFLVLLRNKAYKIHFCPKTILIIFALSMCCLQVLNNIGLFTGTLLMIFCALGLMGCVLWGIILLISYTRKQGAKELLQTWGIFLFCVIVLALPQLFFWTFSHVIGNTSMLRGHFNWGNQGDFYLWFYIKNMGPVLLLAIIAMCHKRKEASCLFFPILLIWFVVELVVFQPNVYDNNKLLYIAYLFLCLIAADYGVELYKKVTPATSRKWLAGTFLFCCVISAVLTLGREAVSKYTLYGNNHVKLAEYIEEHTSPKAVILTDVRHNNEIASLTGRNLVCGADAFLYYHGIDTTQRKQYVQYMYEFPLESLHLYEHFDVDYILVSNWERSSYGVDEAMLEQLFTLDFALEDIRLYRVK